MARVMSLVAPFLLLSVGGAQFGKIKTPTIGDAAKALGAEAIFKKGPSITTNIKDAKYAKAHEGAHDGAEGRKDLFDLPRTKMGGFTLAAGAYAATLQSYCLHAGTHAPSSGDGYLYAPVKGPYEKFVTAVARRSVDHPRIAQRDVQTLVWALIARAKPSDMTGAVKETANALLTREERSSLDGGALALLENDQLMKAIGGQPPLLRQVYEAEARLRSAFSGSPSYDQLEGIAVLAGNPAVGPGSREVRSGEWSLHPRGYWVRYFPSGYSTTKIEIDVPREAVGKEFDPAEEVATPGNTARQRLLLSGRRKGSE